MTEILASQYEPIHIAIRQPLEPVEKDPRRDIENKSNVVDTPITLLATPLTDMVMEAPYPEDL